MQKLELTWIGKDDAQQPLEPRILIENPQYSYGTVEEATLPSGKPWHGNMLIHGDNLLALRSLATMYAGEVKCIYIDPPYNTGHAFEQYDDMQEHSTWLNLMRSRIRLLYNLLSEQGSLWISIDDDERDYLKIVCDEIFGRNNFVTSIVWQKKFSSQANAEWLSDSHDYILIYAKNKSLWRPNLLPRTDEVNSRYKNPDNDSRGPWTSGDCSVSLMSGQRGAQYAKTGYSPNIYEITTPSGRIVSPPTGNCWRFSKERFAKLVSDNRIWFGSDGNNVPRYKRFLSEVKSGVVAQTWWSRDEVGDNQEAKRETKDISKESVFATPKPERLIERILMLGSNPGDIVLDSFLGSGTTVAVAQKMGRRYIGIELGDHAYTHCKPRLEKVVNGGDNGGITKSQNWQGGGGFKFYELAPSLLKHDEFGQLIINPEYNADQLAAAMAMQEGYTYAPSADTYWKQGRGSECDYIFTTTQFITAQTIDRIAESMTEGESLLICCTACQKEARNRHSNITVKKIPQMLLRRCEFDRDNYNLNIVCPPHVDETDEDFED